MGEPPSSKAREAMHAMIASACLGVSSDAEFARDLRGFLERYGLDADDVDAIVSAPRRLGVYRRLVRNNLAGVIQTMMPRTRAWLNREGGAFDATVAEFLDAAAPRTHYLRDVPAEFLAWAAPRWRARGELPRGAPDLAAFELIEFRLAAAPPGLDEPTLVEVTLERPLVFAEAVELVHYDFAVHELPRDAPLERYAELAPRPTNLLAYRDARHAVRFLELTPLAALVLGELFTGKPLGEALKRACAAQREPLTAAVTDDTARLLADLAERGVLLGGS